MAEKKGVEVTNNLTAVVGTNVATQVSSGGVSSDIIANALVRELSASSETLKHHTGANYGAYNRCTVKASTTDNTTTVIKSIAVPSGSSCHVRAFIGGKQNDESSGITATAVACVTNAAGTTAVEGTALYQIVEDDAGTNVTITANNTADTVEVNIVGVTAETWYWVGFIEWFLIAETT